VSERKRAPVGGTSRVLLVGTMLSAVAFVVGLGLTFLGVAGGASIASGLGIVVLLVTPAVALVVSAVELRASQPQAAKLAVAVLGVLVVAVGVALFAH